VLDEEPFCRVCLNNGRHVASDVVDHIKPLAWGGSDERSNKQALCVPCHDAKSKAERARSAAARIG
jgi:5-methylcytosine-specific restriction protein A